jgi:hypothetical protein
MAFTFRFSYGTKQGISARSETKKRNSKRVTRRAGLRFYKTLIFNKLKIISFLGITKFVPKALKSLKKIEIIYSNRLL